MPPPAHPSPGDGTSGVIAEALGRVIGGCAKYFGDLGLLESLVRAFLRAFRSQSQIKDNKDGGVGPRPLPHGQSGLIGFGS